jgi:hypothetical protein
VESDILADRRRGRGAQTNVSGRYEPVVREAFDDEWRSLEELPALKTDVQIERARKIITRNQSPDISFDRSTRIAAASTAAPTASRARRTRTWGCRRGWISNRGSS